MIGCGEGGMVAIQPPSLFLARVFHFWLHGLEGRLPLVPPTSQHGDQPSSLVIRDCSEIIVQPDLEAAPTESPSLVITGRNWQH